jgi:type IV pilus assembly protein PilE
MLEIFQYDFMLRAFAAGAIIGILAAIAIPSYMKYIRSARTTEATSNLAAIQSYEESYFSENDTYLSAGANPESSL